MLMTQLLHADLTYRIRGLLFKVHNELGPLLQERLYRDAIGIGLKQAGLSYELEKGFEVLYEGARVGLYYIDVWIEHGKVLLELKVAQAIDDIHKAQAISYLKVTDADMAMVANFGAASLAVERLPNFLRKRQPAEFQWQPQKERTELIYPELTDTIQRACYRVHFVLGPGFLHQIYRRAMMIELERSRVSFEYLKQLPIAYQGNLLGYQEVRLIFIEGKILLATFAYQDISEAMLKQFKGYLRQMQVQLGFMANFHGKQLTMTAVRA
ncbi:hypothetical protein U27_06320 [Candidatus Vecturithrix granuli]|uniref:GxxExxY protein n=1 Tax=Vecturithrix granuli TaxID=1499967 RepID=A0A081C431_VECG1|nr:hypothetical protein U27_06320 [Candidatus Vecturithrix granuli]